MKKLVTVSKHDNELISEIEEMTHTRIGSCYQCGKCTGGCPIAGEQNGGPREVIRMLQLGDEEGALQAGAAWRCVGCLTCGNRCPIGIEIPKIMDAVRQLAERKGIKLDEDSMKMKSFVDAFLNSVMDYGRLYEPTMMVEYNVNSGYLVTNFHKGIAFLSKAKLHAWPARVKKIERLRRMIARIAEEEQWHQ